MLLNIGQFEEEVTLKLFLKNYMNKQIFLNKKVVSWKGCGEPQIPNMELT